MKISGSTLPVLYFWKVLKIALKVTEIAISAFSGMFDEYIFTDGPLRPERVTSIIIGEPLDGALS